MWPGSVFSGIERYGRAGAFGGERRAAFVRLLACRRRSDRRTRYVIGFERSTPLSTKHVAFVSGSFVSFTGFAVARLAVHVERDVVRVGAEKPPRDEHLAVARVDGDDAAIEFLHLPRRECARGSGVMGT